MKDFKVSFVNAGDDPAVRMRLDRIRADAGEKEYLIAGAVHTIAELVTVGVSKIRADMGDNEKAKADFMAAAFDTYTSALAFLTAETGEHLGANQEKTMAAIAGLKLLAHELEQGVRDTRPDTVGDATTQELTRIFNSLPASN